jgi:hypothetical protein
MNFTMKTVSALSIAIATLAASGLPSRALPNERPGEGNITTVYGQPKPQPKLPPAATKFGNPNLFKVLGSTGYHCLVCGDPRPQPTGPNSGEGWGRGHGWHDGWRDRPEIIVGGAPEVVTVAAPVEQSVPARSPAMAAPISAQATEPCNCLTKQSLPDGSVLFQDICTKESAIASPAQVGAR